LPRLQRITLHTINIVRTMLETRTITTAQTAQVIRGENES
jgi:hypothetical protein